MGEVASPHAASFACLLPSFKTGCAWSTRVNWRPVRCASCARWRTVRRMSSDSKNEPFEHAEEIERRLGLPSGFLARRRSSPGGPRFYKLGRRTVVYRPSEVTAWLDRCASDPEVECIYAGSESRGGRKAQKTNSCQLGRLLRARHKWTRRRRAAK
jgi:hypothetical protein